MTVKELIGILEQFKPDLSVVSSGIMDRHYLCEVRTVGPVKIKKDKLNYLIPATDDGEFAVFLGVYPCSW